MARYHYTRENENGVVLYLESEPAEDAMDEFDDEIAVGFSGNGYLSFWTRCRKAAEALPNGLKYAAGGRCVITDTFTRSCCRSRRFGRACSTTRHGHP